MVERDGGESAVLLKALRVSRGLRQLELAAATGVSQAMISKAETGAVDFDESRWTRIAEVLGVPTEAFTGVSRPLSPTRVFHRKQKTTSTGDVNKIEADLTLTQQRAQSLLGEKPTSLRRHDTMDGLYTPMEIALSVREELGLGTGPVSNLTAVLEGAGVVIIRWPLASLQADAIAGWPEGGLPVLLLGEHAPAERQRFTMAHELGHAVLHTSDPSPDQESEADEFAAEFLMPTEAVRHQWPVDANLDTLIPLKRQWGISLSALIRRGRDSGQLDDRQYRSWMIRLTGAGMHRNEPATLAAEQPVALQQFIEGALQSGATLDDLAGKARMFTPEFQSIFYPKETA